MTLLEMTLSGGVIILLITVIRALAVERLPKRLFLALWGAALLRLLIPFSVPFRFSLFSLAERGYYAVNTSAVATRNKELAIAARRSLVSVQAVSDSVSPWTVLWLLGVGLALIFFIAAYARHLRRFRSAKFVDNGFIRDWLASHPLRRTISIRESGSVTAPLTYGVLRPVILLPTELDWEDTATLNYAFTHEYTHIRRFDALLRLLLMAALCVHWFNPLVWVMYILALRDIELSCDEAVVRRFGFESRRAYALALLKMEETRLRFNAFASSFSRNAAEERLRAIMKLRKPTAPRAVLSVLLVLCAFGLLCTSAGAAEPEILDAAEPPAISEAPDGEGAPDGGQDPSYLRHCSIELIRYHPSASPIIGDVFNAAIPFVKLEQGWAVSIYTTGSSTFERLEVGICNAGTGEILWQTVTLGQRAVFKAPSDGGYLLLLREHGSGSMQVSLCCSVVPTSNVQINGAITYKLSAERDMTTSKLSAG